ncbi:hypothetical protein [Fischerella thermalis]|uniref:hypothetical protein n=1 Tax=Fischerella thermalis TaxID=372787 RepID=UPI00307EBDE3
MKKISTPLTSLLSVPSLYYFSVKMHLICINEPPYGFATLPTLTGSRQDCKWTHQERQERQGR